MTDYLTRLTAALGNQYAIERELGRGGMATVYLAHDRKHHRRVAIKVLRPELTAALGPERFLREIEIAAQFNHPHIVPVYDSGEAQGLLYYVMPYVVGESLRRRLSRQGELPIDEAVEIACEVANALGYAHAQGIVHRDIKPENILLAEGHAIVADFGIARAISAAVSAEHDAVTGTGFVVGTPLYMSPEQVAADLRIDGRSDVYSLGCVMYEMLVGEPPFTGPTPQSVTSQHAIGSVPPIRARRPEVPVKLEQVVMKALQKIPADRFATASEFEAALPSHRTPPEPQIPTVPTPVQRGHRVPVSRAGWAVIGALVLAAALTATAFHRRSAPVMNQSLYMVLPFRHRAASAPRLLNGDQCESLLHDALARWRGVQMVDPLWVADARSRRGGTGSIDDGLSIARERRAGRVVLGEVWEFKDTIYVRGLLYDAAGQKLVREQSIRIAPDLSDAQSRFEELADSLLIGGGVATGSSAPERRPTLASSLACLSGCVSGDAALGPGFGQGPAAAGARHRSVLRHGTALPGAGAGLERRGAEILARLCGRCAELGRQPLSPGPRVGRRDAGPGRPAVSLRRATGSGTWSPGIRSTLRPGSVWESARERTRWWCVTQPVLRDGGFAAAIRGR